MRPRPRPRPLARTSFLPPRRPAAAAVLAVVGAVGREEVQFLDGGQIRSLSVSRESVDG